jgi:hypothetical protein
MFVGQHVGLIACQHSGAWNFEVAPRFLENLPTDSINIMAPLTLSKCGGTNALLNRRLVVTL